MSLLSHADAAWLHMEQPDNLMMITGLLYLDRVPSRDHLEAVLRHRLCRFERFKMRVSEGKLGMSSPRWVVAEEFSVADHLVYETLERPTERELLRRCGELMSEPLDRSKPLWEFRVFGLVGEKACLVVRLHHAIADGIALMRVLLTLCDASPNTLPPTSHTILLKEQVLQGLTKAKKLASRFLHDSHDILFHPSLAKRFAQESWKAGTALGRLLSLPEDSPNAFRGPLSRKKVTAVSRPFSLNEVKLLGIKWGCTINDILMSVLAGGLGRSLSRVQAVGDELEIRAVVPVDLRGGKVDELGNRFGLVFLTLPVGCPDPVERTNLIRAHMAKLKESAEAVVAFELLSAVGAVPSAVEKPIIEWFGNKATTVVTNLPGPREPLFLAGSKLEGIMYWVPQSGKLGLGMSLMSYAGEIRLGVTSDAHLIPDPNLLVQDFESAYQECLER